MEDSNIEETITISSDDAAFYIKIKDFRSATEKLRIDLKFVHTDKRFEYSITAEIIPNHVENTDCWLAFNPKYTIQEDLINKRNYNYLLCTVSIIDVEGNSRIPRYFEKNLLDLILIRTYYYQPTRVPKYLKPHPTEDPKYLKKSAILEREDEFLPDGVLTLRVDFTFESRSIDELKEINFEHPPHLFSLCYKECTEPWKNIFAEYSNIKVCGIFDYTCKILDLPQFHEVRIRFGLYGIPHELSPSSELEEVNPDFFEHVWIFDIKFKDQRYFYRFLLSLDEREDSVGTRFLRSSPVLRLMVNAPMREQQEKRIEFLNIEHVTFQWVLAFLHGTVLPSIHFILLDLYKFSHLYQMEELQRKCAKCLVGYSKNERQLEELDRIADLYQDKNLSEPLKMLRNEHDILTVPPFRADDKPNSDCFV